MQITTQSKYEHHCRSEEEKIVVGLLVVLLLEVAVGLDEGVVGVVEQELEVFEELVLVGVYHVVEERIARTADAQAVFLQREASEGLLAFDFLNDGRGRRYYLHLHETGQLSLELLDYPQVPGVANIFIFLLSFWFESFYIAPQNANFLVQAASEVEAVKLSQSQLVVIVIESFL